MIETPTITPTELSTVFTVTGTSGNGVLTVLGSSTSKNWKLSKNGVLIADSDGLRLADANVVNLVSFGILDIAIPVVAGTTNTYILDIDCHILSISDQETPAGTVSGNVNIIKVGSGFYKPIEFDFSQYTYQTPV